MPLTDYDFHIYYGPQDNRLRDFYLPALARSVHYDRTAGFFSSSALAIAAAGVVRLIENGGTMRLLVGAKLTQDDVEAVTHGEDLRTHVTTSLLAAFPNPVDALQRQRLEVLAWMVANERLVIKVVVARDARGHPIPGDAAMDYYHSKSGLFTDTQGNRLAFSGSINESATGWLHNYEEFAVYRSWNSTHAYLAHVAANFDKLWHGQEPNWVAFDFPEAVQQRLISYRPDEVPTRDAFEPTPQPHTAHDAPPKNYIALSQRERLIFQYLRDAPALLHAERLGQVTSAITPWPHQARVAQQIADRFPERFLLADEVGLGKTIEAGLALRQLLLTGRVKRALLLTPKSVNRQWQEELYEKCALNLPRYDGFRFVDYFDTELPITTPNPWDSYPVFIASSQLAKRHDRAQTLLTAQPWDLVLVDEAHHARRKDFLQNIYRPNRLLELLLKLKDRTAGLILLTATPMQVAPVEVWDLLRLLGLGGKWAADEDNFLQFFEELRRPFNDVDWDFVFAMARDSLDHGQTLDLSFTRLAEQRLGLVEWEQIRTLPHNSHPATVLRQLSPAAQNMAREFARQLSPLNRFMFRHTRTLLRDYQRRGLLRERVPERDPQPEWINFAPEESELYHRIEEYISDFYQRYERERKGLGFIMTVYRRRLTSSFAAIRCSLERRLKFLKGQPEPGSVAGFTDEDLEQDDLQFDLGEEAEEQQRTRFQAEVVYVQDFLNALRHLGADSKFERLTRQLSQIFRARDKVIIFTQYTDTLDDLREHLRETYGASVACYSGRGGEYWTGIGWEIVSKDRVKQDFREGDQLKILLCTESASEGLNLQTCGVLINYDMPWNPMRVEQRIGRIDRIGQRYDKVWIRNYFIADTVEAIIYQRLSDRIEWFEAVVGDLQPILSRVARSIQTLAMMPEAERQHRLEAEIGDLRRALDEQKTQALSLEAVPHTADGAPLPPIAPLTLADLERCLTQSTVLVGRFKPHPEIARAYLLQHDLDILPVTFDAHVFDDFPKTVRLLTYGDPLLDELLAEVSAPAVQAAGELAQLQLTTPWRTIAYAAPTQPNWLEALKPLETLAAQSTLGAWTEDALALRQTALLTEHTIRAEAFRAVLIARNATERATLIEKGRQLLLHAALIEIALGQQPELFGAAYPYEFSETAVTGLKRHKHPYAPLLRLVSPIEARPSPTDPYYLRVQNQSAEALKQKFAALTAQADDLITAITDLGRRTDQTLTVEVTPLVQQYVVSETSSLA